MPIELSMPASVSATRGTGLPMRRFGVTLLVTSAPRRPRSIASAYSCAKQPDAGITGFFSRRLPTVTPKSATLHLSSHGPEGKPRALAAYAPEYLAARLVEQAHAGKAHAHGAGHLLLEGNFPFHAQPLQQLEQAVGAAGIDHVEVLLCQQSSHQGFD